MGCMMRAVGVATSNAVSSGSSCSSLGGVEGLGGYGGQLEAVLLANREAALNAVFSCASTECWPGERRAVSVWKQRLPLGTGAVSSCPPEVPSMSNRIAESEFCSSG